ncbi:ATP-dependent DNA helicase RecQ [Favolaschia claudopus]|uniref:ATP-dependent DNA helicase RecQ n=1 Tax=Favolaschia claudopus TaxID=2862362 RepID=A0AAW0C1A7_9AGAR
MALRAALHSFRKSRTAEVFGPFHFRKHGAGGIMANEVLDRIADCAHFHKIQTTADLARETDWHRITEDGTQILALITQHRPIPVPAAPTPRPLLPLNTNTPVYSTPKNRKCSKCGLSGHIASNRKKCPRYSPRTSGRRASTTENTPRTPTNCQSTSPAFSQPPFNPSTVAPTSHLPFRLPFGEITNRTSSTPIQPYNHPSIFSPYNQSSPSSSRYFDKN